MNSNNIAGSVVKSTGNNIGNEKTITSYTINTEFVNEHTVR